MKTFLFISSVLCLSGTAEQKPSSSLITFASAAGSWAPSSNIQSVQINEKGEMEVYYRKPSSFVYASIPPQSPPDEIWRDVYGVKDGKIVFLRKEEPKVIPAAPERIEWPSSK